MALETVKIVGIEARKKQSTGQVFYFMDVVVQQKQTLFLNDEAIKLLQTYESLRGQEVAIEAEWRTRDGKPQLQMLDPVPRVFSSVPVPVPAPLASAAPVYVEDAQPKQVGPAIARTSTAGAAPNIAAAMSAGAAK